MGKITRKEKLGLILAAMADNQLVNLKKENLRFTKKAEDLILEFKDKLPTSEFLEPIPGKNKTWDNPIKLWILKNQLNLANFLYYTTIASYAFLFLNIVLGPRDLIIKFLEKLRG